MYNKTAMVDFDDTLSFTTNRDFVNARCDYDIVAKLHQLKALGWTIVIQTARGYLSCNGDRAAADKKYRGQIESWLKQHGVPYDELTFEKRLAQLYIDDKAMTPESFKDTVFTEEKGLSGAYVIRIGNRIHKTSPTVKKEAEWYDKAGGFYVPDNRILCGETLSMDFIPTNSGYKWYPILDVLDTMSMTEVDCKDWSHYIDRLKDHASLAGLDCSKIEQLGMKFETRANEHQSFCHGDFSIENIIWFNERPYLIDPIDMSDSYSSWVLDYSKLIQSAERAGVTIKTELLLSQGFLNFLVMSHWLRLIKYVSGELKERAVQKVKAYVEER
jgi:capsule biosynthesis phosphatase